MDDPETERHKVQSEDDVQKHGDRENVCGFCSAADLKKLETTAAAR